MDQLRHTPRGHAECDESTRDESGANLTFHSPLCGGFTAAITHEAVTDLGLAAGSAVTALIKSTEVSLATV